MNSRCVIPLVTRPSKVHFLWSQEILSEKCAIIRVYVSDFALHKGETSQVCLHCNGPVWLKSMEVRDLLNSLNFGEGEY